MNTYSSTRTRTRVSVNAPVVAMFLTLFTASCYPTVCAGQLSFLSLVEQEMNSSSMAAGWRPYVADWGDGVFLAAPWVKLFISAGNVWQHNMLKYHIEIW